MFRNIYSTTANQINDPYVFFQTELPCYNINVKKYTLYMSKVYVQATWTIKQCLAKFNGHITTPYHLKSWPIFIHNVTNNEINNTQKMHHITISLSLHYILCLMEPFILIIVFFFVIWTHIAFNLEQLQ